MSLDALGVRQAIERLVGSVDRLLVAATLSLVVAQRLVDRVSDAAFPANASASTTPRSTDAVAVAETLVVTEPIRDKILAHPEAMRSADPERGFLWQERGADRDPGTNGYTA